MMCIFIVGTVPTLFILNIETVPTFSPSLMLYIWPQQKKNMCTWWEEHHSTASQSESKEILVYLAGKLLSALQRFVLAFIIWYIDGSVFRIFKTLKTSKSYSNNVQTFQKVLLKRCIKSEESFSFSFLHKKNFKSKILWNIC